MEQETAYFPSSVLNSAVYMKNRMHLALWALLTAWILFSSTIQAAVTTLAWYRLGEADVGAQSGQPVNSPTQESNGSNPLLPFNGPHYMTNVASTAMFAVDSSVEVNFDGFSQFLSNAVVSTAIDNFGLEAWVRPGLVGPGIGYILCNGDPNFGSAWSIARDGSQYECALGFSVVATGGTATPGVWAHVAFVCESGIGELYVDGALVGSGFIPSGGVPGGGFAVAARPSTPAADFFNGDIDEVRVFTFTPGQFSTNDLLLNRTNVRTFAATSVTLSNATLSGSLYRPSSQPLPANGWFEWGIAPNYGNSTPPQFFGTGAVMTNYSQVITGLTLGTLYQFRAAADTGGTIVYGTNRTFATPGPQVTTLAAAIAPPNATLNGSINPGGANSLAWFEWGATTNYGNLTQAQAVGAGTTLLNFNQLLNTLGGGTYHFRAVGSNSVGMVKGSDQLFVMPLFINAGLTLPGVAHSSIAWGDYDNDGRLDILLTGQNTNGTAISQVWRNTGNGFTNINAGLPGVSAGSAAWCDFNNDGRLDILLSGLTDAGLGLLQVWRNTGSGFAITPVVVDTGTNLFPKSAFTGDYDRDGLPDILLSYTNSTLRTAPTGIWRNNGNGFTELVPELTDVPLAVPWGNFENNGRLEILSVFQPGAFGNVSARFACLGDFDNDGRLDILLCGTTNGFLNGSVVQIWRNTGTGFTNLNVGLPSVYGPVACGDFDNDGRLDLVFAGTDRSALPTTQIWLNTGNGFTNLSAGLPGFDNASSIALGDYDNDGRLDILLAGSLGGVNGASSQLWRNNFPFTNTPPLAPLGLSVSATGTVATLKWNLASDAQTPSAALSYNLRIGTSPGASDILAPASAGNGRRRLPQLGNAQEGSTMTFTYIPGTPYYWSVQAVDGSYGGSPFSAEASFRILSPAASVVQAQTTNQPPGDLNGDGIVDQSELDTVLANYYPTSPWLYLTNVAGLGGTNVTFALTNSTAGAFSVEYSTNLADWYFLGPATPRYLFNDTNAQTTPQRYYRLRWP